jgi:hypothetical protein
MAFVFSKWRLKFNASAQGVKLSFSHELKVQFPNLMEYFYNDKTLIFIASKIGEVLEVKLVSSYIKRFANSMTMVELQDISKLVEFIKIPSLE